MENCLQGLLALYLSFSRAGWFCRFGRRADNLPVSVLMFKLQWMRSRFPALSLVAISLPCRGFMKLLSRVSMAPSSHKASTAEQRCTVRPNSACTSTYECLMACCKLISMGYCRPNWTLLVRLLHAENNHKQVKLPFAASHSDSMISRQTP